MASSSSVSSAFASMSYGPAPESDEVAQAWLDDHERAFGHFIDNKCGDGRINLSLSLVQQTRDGDGPSASPTRLVAMVDKKNP